MASPLGDRLPSERYGEEVMGWIKLRDGVSLTADERRAACQGRTRPTRSRAGKVQKLRMRELAIEELELQLAAGIATA